MEDATLPQTEPQRNETGIGALLGQLGDDAKAFALAEANYIKAAAGERATYAKPALLMIGVGLGIGMGGLISLPIGLVWVLAPAMGTSAALGVVVAASILVAALLGWMGARRLAKAFKSPEDR